MRITSLSASNIILLITLALSLTAIFGSKNLYDKLLFHPWSIKRNNEWHRFVTMGFIHADISHLLFNMLTFYFFAYKLELLFGTKQFIVIYFGSMIISSITTYIKQRDNPDYRAVGASGAISGVLFSYILFDPATRIAFFFIPVGIPAPIFAILYLTYCWYAARHARDYVNHSAHLWGALAGLVLTIIMAPGIVPFFLKHVF